MVKFVLGALVGAVGYKLWVDEKESRDSIQKAKGDQPTPEAQEDKVTPGTTEFPKETPPTA